MIDILYEDDSCLVVAKPAGLLTQAPLGIDSLEFQIKRLLKERDSLSGGVYLGVPHRLDRPASGAIVFAKNLKAAQRISKQFESRRVEKTYWGLVEGNVGTAYRHRAQVLPLLLVLAAGGMDGDAVGAHFPEKLFGARDDGGNDFGGNEVFVTADG